MLRESELNNSQRGKRKHLQREKTDTQREKRDYEREDFYYRCVSSKGAFTQFFLVCRDSVTVRFQILK
jgi:hypothetical protein